MKSFTECPEEVRERVNALLEKYYADTLREVGLKIDLLFVSTDSEDTPALTHGGYPAAAVVRIVSAKDRVKGCGDAEITIDEAGYIEMTGAERDALLDHELYHLQLVLGRNGLPKRDDTGRPKLKMRKHDYQVGHFHEIARRHKEASGEVQQAAAFIREQGQIYFGFADELREAIAATLPTEDSVARDSMPERSAHVGNVTERLLDQAAEGRGVQGFVEMAKRDGVSMEIRAGDKSVKIDATGIHPQPTDEQLDEATRIAHAERHVTRAMLQRRLRVGYNHACAIVDRLVAAKIVAPETEAGRFETVDKGPKPDASASAPEPAAAAA